LSIVHPRLPVSPCFFCFIFLRKAGKPPIRTLAHQSQEIAYVFIWGPVTIPARKISSNRANNVKNDKVNLATLFLMVFLFLSLPEEHPDRKNIY
jgi:hypothetical protein